MNEKAVIATSTREKSIKTNSAVKINLTAYKKCHNYHLKAIVLGLFYLNADETHQQQCEGTFTLWREIIRIKNVFLKISKPLKKIYGPVDTGQAWTRED